MMPLTITWTLEAHGWSFIKVSDGQAETEVIASYVTGGPEQFLRAIVSLAHFDPETRAEFEGEPQVYTWIFRREGDDADIKLLRADDSGASDQSAQVLWTSRQPIIALVRAAVRAFDQLVHEHGEDGYETQWGRAFPRAEVETLRGILRTRGKGARIPDING